jgi:hypothetical protein
MLKVPSFVAGAAAPRPPAAPTAGVAPAPPAGPADGRAEGAAPTRALPVAARPAPGPPVPPGARGGGPVPRWARLALWIVAVPVSFFCVFGVARTLGLFTTDQLSDVFLADGASRFWPLARLLPFVALVMAGVVHGGVVVLARRKRRTAGPPTR